MNAPESDDDRALLRSTSSSAMLRSRGSSQSRLWLVRLIARQRPPRDLGREARGCAARPRRRCRAAVAEAPRAAPRRCAGVADHAEVDRAVRADRLEVGGRPGSRSSPARSARRGGSSTSFSAAPNARIRSDSFSSALRERRGEAARDAEVERVAGEQPVGRPRWWRAAAPSRSPSARSAGPAFGQDGAAAGDDRGPLGARRARGARRSGHSGWSGRAPARPAAA